MAKSKIIVDCIFSIIEREQDYKLTIRGGSIYDIAKMIASVAVNNKSVLESVRLANDILKDV